MFEAFYGLKEKPFNATPDPKFLFMTPSHREALAHLVFGVQEDKGFLVLTGEVGTGKTTLLNALLRKLDAGSTAVSFIYNSTLTFDEILEYMLKDFGVKAEASTRVQRLIALNAFLIEQRRAGRKSVVIFDEAQNLETSILEQVRLLSNFETPSEKLLQIMLIGQPELKTKLQLPSLRQLKQRIALRCTIHPLAGDEVRDYGRRAHRPVRRWDPARDQHGLRPLLALGLRAPQAADRSGHRREGRRVPGGRGARAHGVAR